MSKERFDIGIIGGGIIGTAIALNLARAGEEVVLWEKSTIGSEASGRNGGGVRQQNRHPAELPLAIRSVEIWSDLDNYLGFTADVEYVKEGNVRVALTQDDLTQMKVDVERQGKGGLAVHLLGIEDTFKIVPHIDRSKILGSTFCPTDGHANPILASKVFGKAAEQAGATILENDSVCDLKENNNGVQVKSTSGLYYVDKLINAAGAWSAGIGRLMGIELPLQIEISLVAVTEKTGRLFSQFVYREGFGYTRQSKSGNVHLGTHLFTPWPIENRTVPLMAFPRFARLSRLIPVLGDLHLIRSWSGFTSWTRDKTAIIDFVPGSKRLFVCCGFSGHGFCMAPAVGEMVARMIKGEKSDFNWKPFSLERF